MKRQSVLFILSLTLVSGALSAQTTGTTNPSNLPADQRVDQSGKPETGSGIDVDVDAGRNAEDGLVDVDVTSQTDSDTAATGNDPNPVVRGTTATGTTTGTMSGSALRNEPEEGMDVDVDAGRNANGAVDVDVNRTSDADTDASGIDETGSLDQESTTGVAGDDDSLPATGSDLPAVALLGLLAMAAAFSVRFLRS
jgi:LPXTG-motif cell wall-anchored protein